MDMKIKLSIALALLAAALLLCLLFWTLYDEAKLITLRAENDVYPRGVDTIICTLTNHSYRAIRYGEAFSVERFSDGQWSPVDESDSGIRFQTLEKRLGALSSAVLHYRVSAFSSFADGGDYRIVISVKAGDKDYTLYCGFSVE